MVASTVRNGNLGAADPSTVALKYWEYYLLAASDDPHDRREAEALWDDAENVNAAAQENSPGVIALLVTVAESAPDALALAFLGAGPIEDLLASHATEVVDAVDEAAQRSEKF